MNSSHTKPDSFTLAWWDCLVDVWNGSPHAGSLAGLGVVWVCFRVLESNLEPVWIEWYAVGQARRVLQPVKRTPCFSATAADWQAFMRGEIQAAVAVILGRIVYQGDLTRILQYSRSFNLLAAVASVLRQ